MKKKIILTDEILWDYADGLLPASEIARVDAALQQHPEWQEHLRLIEEEKQLLASLPLEIPGPGFSDQVMAAWTTAQAQNQTAKGKDWIIRLMALIFLLLVLAPVLVMVFELLKITPAELPVVNLPELPAIDWITWLNSPILLYGSLLVAAILGLRFLEKILQHQGWTHKLA